jgi:hypothetical protein
MSPSFLNLTPLSTDGLVGVVGVGLAGLTIGIGWWWRRVDFAKKASESAEKARLQRQQTLHDEELRRQKALHDEWLERHKAFHDELDELQSSAANDMQAALNGQDGFGPGDSSKLHDIVMRAYPNLHGEVQEIVLSRYYFHMTCRAVMDILRRKDASLRKAVRQHLIFSKVVAPGVDLKSTAGAIAEAFDSQVARAIEQDKRDLVERPLTSMKIGMAFGEKCPHDGVIYVPYGHQASHTRWLKLLVLALARNLTDDEILGELRIDLSSRIGRLHALIVSTRVKVGNLTPQP